MNGEKRQHRMLVEFIKKESTVLGMIDIKESIKIINEINKIAKKNGWECYLKGQKKEVLDYHPTNETYEIKTVEDIAKLSPEQFEMFVEDLRNWCDVQRGIVSMKEMGLDISSPAGMTWLDTGKHESMLDVSMHVTNKINLSIALLLYLQMQLTPLQQFIQDKILLSIYPGCSIEEARLKDFNIGCGCDRGNYPPTLSRVLTAFGIEFYFWNGIRHSEKISNNYENRKYICDRKLLNEDNTDCTLFDQSPETQRAMALLLGWKDE